jgi:hypothetical protein
MPFHRKFMAASAFKVSVSLCHSISVADFMGISANIAKHELNSSPQKLTLEYTSSKVFFTQYLKSKIFTARTINCSESWNIIAKQFVCQILLQYTFVNINFYLASM